MSHATHVLVAEDHEVNQLVITGMLTAIGCSYDLAQNGAEAVDLFRDRRYDMVLLDCEMPVMDGFGAAREMRAIEQAQNRPRTPIAALTAHALQEVKNASLEAGMDDFMAKPISLPQIQALITKWVK